jgi:hypothetical protein
MHFPTEHDDLPSRAELARDLLLCVMKEHAEDWCASWLVDQEFELWEAACHGSFPALSVLDERRDLAKRLGDLGALAGGWWAMPRHVGKEGHEPIFVSLEEFGRFYSAWKKTKSMKQPPS